jgi:hypothetical protein
MSDMIRVKTAEGRIARTSPRGDFIPTEYYINVELTGYVQRLIEVHGDLIVEPEEPETPAVIATPTKSAPAAKDKE